jgi:hypothetical protein
MTSMQEALAEALEHPITELPSRSAHRSKKRRGTNQKSTQSSDSLLWGIVGSIVGSLLIFGVYKSRQRS